MGIQDDAKRVMKNMDVMVMAIKGKGGYKDRKMFRLSDVEFDKFFLECINKFQIIAVGIVVAEAMLQEPAPSIHPRWEEYMQRRAECMKELDRK